MALVLTDLRLIVHLWNVVERKKRMFPPLVPVRGKIPESPEVLPSVTVVSLIPVRVYL